MTEHDADRPPELTGAEREGTVTAGTLIVHFTWQGLQDELGNCVAPEATKQYGDLLMGAGLLSKKNWAQLCEDNLWFEFLHRRTHHHLSEISEPMREVVLDLLSRGGGVRLPPQAAARGQRLMERMDDGKPLFTASERRRMEKALGGASIPASPSEARAALEKAVAAGGATGLEALPVLASLVACIAKGVVYDTMSGFCGPIIDGYARYAEEDGYARFADLPVLDESERSAPLRESVDRICAESAARMSDMLGWVLVDILSRADGLELTAAAARRALTLLQRHEADEEIVPIKEDGAYVNGLRKGAPSSPAKLYAALQKIAGTKEAVAS